MLYYYYDQTGKLLNTVELSQDPYNPSGWTKVPPSERPAEFIEGKSISLYNTASNKWEWFPDYGLVWNIHTKESKSVEIGYVLTDSDTLKSPLPDENFQKFENGEWVIDVPSKLDFLKSKLKNEISVAVNNEIIKGYSFGGYHFDSTLEDQFNIKTSLDIGVNTGTPIPIRCLKDGETAKQFQAFDIEFLGNLVLSFADRVKSIRQQGSDMKVAIDGFTSIDELEDFKIVFS